MPVATSGTRTKTRDALVALPRQIQSLGACVQLLRSSAQLHATAVRQMRDNTADLPRPEADPSILQHTAEELRQHLERLHTLVTLHRLFASGPPATRMLQSIVSATATVLDIPHVAIWAAEPAAQRLVLRTASNARLRQSFPDSTLQFGQGSPGWVAYHRHALHVPDVFADDRIITKHWWREYQFRSRLALPLLHGETIVGVLTMIGAAPFHFVPDDQQLLDHLLDHATAVLLQPLADASRTLTPRMLSHVREYIDAHLAAPLSLQELAAVVQLSPSYFARCFAQAMGQTPYQYVLERRLAQAMTLLTSTDNPIAGIARDVGFASQSHLTATFRRLVGCTPKAFRTRL